MSMVVVSTLELAEKMSTVSLLNVRPRNAEKGQSADLYSPSTRAVPPLTVPRSSSSPQNKLPSTFNAIFGERKYVALARTHTPLCTQPSAPSQPVMSPNQPPCPKNVQ